MAVGKSRHWLIRSGLILSWIAVVGYLATNAARRVGGDTGDFVHFFEAARAMVDGRDIYASGLVGYIYPPLLAFLYTPVVGLGERPAQLILLLCNLSFLVGAALLAAHESLRRFGFAASLTATAGVALAGVLLTVDKLKGEIQMWQTNILLLFLFCLAFNLLDRFPALAGAALGFAFNIKYWPIVVLPYLLLRRRWTAAGAFVVSIVVFALVPATLTGWETNLHYQGVAYRGLLRVFGIDAGNGQGANLPTLTDTVSGSIPSAISRLGWLGGSPRVGYAGAALVALAAFLAALWMYRRNGVALLYRPDGLRPEEQPACGVVALEWASLLTCVLLFSPQTNSRHLSLLLFVLTLAAALLFHVRKTVSRTPLLFGTIVLVAGLVLPPGRQNIRMFDLWSHDSVQAWQCAGGPCWCALAMLMTLLWVGLGHAQTLRNISQASGSTLAQKPRTAA